MVNKWWSVKGVMTTIHGIYNVKIGG